MPPSDTDGQNTSGQPDAQLHAEPLSTEYVDAGSNNGSVVPAAWSANDIATPEHQRLLPIIERIGLILVGLLLVGGILAIVLHKNQGQQLEAGSFNPLSVALNPFEATSTPEATSAQTLTVNGQLRANNSLILTPSIQPATGVAGQLYFDQTSNQLAYYNGTQFVTLANGTTIQSNSTVINNSTTTINGTQNATTSIGGSLNTIAKFTGSGSLANSIIMDDGSGTVAIAGNLNLVNTTPTSQMTIWPTNATPGTPDYTLDTQAVEIGTKFQSDVNGIVQGMRFYKGTQNTGTHVGNLWSSAGTNLGSVTFTNESASGWQTALFSHPVAISADTTYIVSYHTNVGNYASDQHYFAFNGFDNPPLHALQDGTDGSNGVFKYNATSIFPNTSSINASNYWVDVLFTPSSNPFFFEINGAQLSSTSLSNNYDLAKRSSGQVFTGINTFRNAIDSAAAFVIQDAESDTLLLVNTAAQEVDITKLAVTGNLYVGTHVVTQGSAPTMVGGPAACTGPTTNVFGNDTAGLISMTTGTGCSGGGKFANVTFHTPFAAAPRVVLTPANAAAALLAAYVDNATISTTSFDLDIAGGTIADSTAYLWYYHILQ